MDYYPAIGMKEILPSVATRIFLEGIMWSEISQAENEKHIMPLLWGTQGGKGKQSQTYRDKE